MIGEKGFLFSGGNVGENVGFASSENKIFPLEHSESVVPPVYFASRKIYDVKVGKKMSFGCVLPDEDCIYLVSDTLMTKQVNNCKTFGCIKKLFVFPDSNVGGLFTGQLTFGEEHTPIAEIAKRLNVSDASDAAQKIVDEIKKYDLDFPVYGYITDASSIIQISINISDTESSIIIKSVDVKHTYFSGPEWVIDAMRNVPVGQPILKWGIELARFAINVEGMMPEAERTIGGMIEVLKVTKDSVEIQTFLP